MVVIVLIVVLHLVNHNMSINTRDEFATSFLVRSARGWTVLSKGEIVIHNLHNCMGGGSESNARTCNIYL